MRNAPYPVRPGSPGFLGLVAAVSALVAFGIDISLPALPHIAREFRATAEAAQFQISGFVAAVAFSQLIVGPLSDRFGRRPVMMFGMALFALAAIGCTLAENMTQLAILRAVQGIGAACGWALRGAIIRDHFEGRDAARMLGMTVTIVTVAPLIAPLIGGWVMAFGGWRWVYGVLALLGLVVAVPSWLALGESNTRLDPDALRVRRLVHNYGSFFRNPWCRGHTALLCLAFCAQFSFVSNSSFVLIEVFGIAPQNYGWYFAMAGIALMAGAQLGSTLTRRLTPRRQMDVGLTVMVIAAPVPLAAALLHLSGAWGIAGLMAPVILYCIGFGVIMPTLVAQTMQPMTHMAGAASAAMGFVQLAGGAATGIAVSAAYDGTPFALAGAIAIFGTGTFLFDRLVVRRLKP